MRYSGHEELKFRQQALAGKREKSKHKQHRHGGVKLLAGLVNNGLRLVDIDCPFQARRRELIGPGEQHGNRKPDRDGQPQKRFAPGGQAEDLTRVSHKPQEQPAGDGIQQRNLEYVAPPNFGEDSHVRILTQQPFATIQPGADPGQKRAYRERTRDRDSDVQ